MHEIYNPIFHVLDQSMFLFSRCQSVEKYDQYLHSQIPFNETTNSTDSPLFNVTSGIPTSFPDNTKYLIIFTGITASVVIFAVVRAVHNFHLLVMSSVTLHDRMLHTILKCPISFFDNNPIGKFNFRFSSFTFTLMLFHSLLLE